MRSKIILIRHGAADGYLLRDLRIIKPDQVWCADITYVPMPQGNAYHCTVLDWHTRCELRSGSACG